MARCERKATVQKEKRKHQGRSGKPGAKMQESANFKAKKSAFGGKAPRPKQKRTKRARNERERDGKGGAKSPKRKDAQAGEERRKR